MRMHLERVSVSAEVLCGGSGLRSAAAVPELPGGGETGALRV
ncbi:hypothetical protein [Streptomyces sp. NPDC003688]